MHDAAIKRKSYDLGTMLPFIAMHASVLLVFTVPFTPAMVGWLAGSYFLRMFGVTGGYHRYFSHRSYKLNRFWQFCLAFLAQTSGQKGALWWAAHHRDHHLHSDRKDRPALARARRLLVVAPRVDPVGRVRPLRSEAHLRFQPSIPELRFLDRFHLMPSVRLRRGDLPRRRLGRVRLGLLRRPRSRSTTARS